MPGEQFSFPPSLSQERGTYRAGRHALGLLENLLAPKTRVSRYLDRLYDGGGARWQADDLIGFEYLARLNESMSRIDLGTDLDQPDDLRYSWEYTMASLPFTEGERTWLFQAYDAHQRRRTDDEPERSFVTKFSAVEAVVVSGGVRRELNGRKMMRRWMSWRRELHEYKNQGLLTRAIFFLDHIAYELAPERFTQLGFRSQYPHVAEYDARAGNPVPPREDSI